MSFAPRRFDFLLALSFAVAVLSICVLRTRAIYLEYYGAGPPYYGRTTNMDKWQSPLPELALSNGLGLSLIALLVYRTRMRRNARPEG